MQNKPTGWPHLCATALLLFIFTAGIYARTRLPLQPISDHDTWGFLFPSLSHMTDGVFRHSSGREFLYPLFVDRVLVLFGTLNALTLIQHILGLLTGALLWLTWKRMERLFPDLPVIAAIHPWIGLAITACYLLSMGPIKMEHSIRPEAIYPFAASAALLCATEFTLAFFIEKRPRSAFFWGIGLVTLALSLLFLKGAFGFGALAAIAPVLISCFQPGASWRYRLGVILIPLVLIAAALWYPEHRLTRRDDPLASAFAQQHLFAFQAKIIRMEIADELEGRRPTVYDRALLETAAQKMDQVLYSGKPHFPTLGFDADDLLYRNSLAQFLAGYFHNDGDQLARFYMHYYWAAWRHHPREMFAKITRQLGNYYQHKSPFDRVHGTISIRHEARHGLETMHPLETPLPLFDQYIAKEQQLETSKQTWRQPHWIFILNRRLAFFFKFCALEALAALACLALTPRLFPAPTNFGRRPLWWFLYLMSWGFFNTLTLAIGHTLDVRRYVQMQLTYTLLAIGCGALLLVIFFWQISRLLARLGPRLAQKHSPEFFAHPKNQVCVAFPPKI